VSGKAVMSLAFSPDNKKLAVGDARGFVVHDLSSFKPSFQVEVKGEARIVAYIDGGKQIVTTGLPPSPLRIWDATTGKPLKVVEHKLGWIGKLVMCPDGRTAVIVAGRSAVLQLDLKTGKVEGAFSAHTGHVRVLAFHDGGRRVLSGSDDGILREWDA